LLIIRPETPEDEAAIRHINEKAFGQKEEGRIIEKLRNRGALTI
jgi:predicted N-acetyltransferase YhbS